MTIPLTTLMPAPVSSLVPAEGETVFRFLSDIEHLPCWAPEYCEKIFVYRDQWWAWTAAGERVVELRTREDQLSVEFHLGETGGATLCFALKVFPLSSGYALVTGVWPGELPGHSTGAIKDVEKLSAAVTALAQTFELADEYCERCAI